MVAGLPGTGIGGLFYLLLAVYMPVCEFFKTLKGQTSLKRWGFIALQISFVVGILSAMWGEVWLLNRTLIWLQETYHLNILSINEQFTFAHSRELATASAMASFISLTFVLAVVCALRLFVSRPQNPAGIRKSSPLPRYQPA